MTLRELRDKLNSLDEKELDQRARYVESYDDFAICPLAMRQATNLIQDKFYREQENLCDLSVHKGEWFFC